MKKTLLLLAICTCMGLVTFFLNRKNPIAEKMEALYGMTVSLPMGEMLLVEPDVKMDSLEGEAKYKMVVFYDSISCSSCAYKNLFIWNDFIEKANKERKRVQFYFIMNPSQENKDDLFITMQMPNAFSESLFIDTAGIFIERNSFLPTERLYHCMLLDNANQIKLVGNPTYNDQLQELYLKTISN